MKRILLFLVTVLIIVNGIAQVQPVASQNLIAVRGHYKTLAAISGAPVPELKAMDTRHFELAGEENKGNTAPQHYLKNCQPAEVIGNGRKRIPFYLSGKEEFAIPAPAANSSLQTRAELNYLLQLQQQRSEEDIHNSIFYAGVYYNTLIKPGDGNYTQMRKNLFHIGRSIGTWFNADSLPVTAALVANVWKDAEYNIWKYKNCFLRIRPYKLEPALKNLEETNWAAYPSGHAANSYVNAFLFSELLPEFTDFFVKDAYDMAHSREIIGVHYPSDSESGRVLAQQLVKQLFSSVAFGKDFEAARNEIQKVKATKGF
jgi:acid phosphatase (class A)